MGNRSSHRTAEEPLEAAPPADKERLSLDGRDGSEAKLPPRYTACELLYEAGIPAAIWLEDALSYHGVPTLVFDLFLLVPDVDAAAQVLVRSGYKRGQLSLALRAIPQFDNLYIPPQPTSTTHEEQDSAACGNVVLLPANEWFHQLPATAEAVTDWFPTLPQLLTALIRKWLSLEEQEADLRLRIVIFIGYIYSYVDAVRAPGFELQLPREYRVFHSDQLQEINTEDLDTFRCQQHYLQSSIAAEQSGLE
ncbi:hypothetical protein C8A03DRAFT_19674 [Achaetomium macrosporum]|uniref:Uncharacterized protein n=1 Tax=Achaetomium macrosporum TaxID=79813 RepID=A0AAN7H9R9_9PEZI|nr:hypothetical protein C8A03DRAFT_19674 [Achaetomium macrosporum]